MKQKVLIFLSLILMVVLLVGLNAATYVQKEKVPDTELAPNRSTYNYGSTGSQAFYSLLSETGRRVRRWQSPLDTISSSGSEQPAVFVMIGPLRRELTEVENTQLMSWVSSGGTLVLIDREPSAQLALTTANWQISVSARESSALYNVDPADQKQMTADTPAIKPSFPSAFAHSVNSVQPSRFASSIDIERFKDVAPTEARYERVQPQASPYDFYGADDPSPPPPPVKRIPSDSNSSVAEDEDTYGDSYSTPDAEIEVSSFTAPVVHLGAKSGNILVEAPFGQGRVIMLSDPYIVSNVGINIADNSRLAVNVVTAHGGMIAFDEYHHGYGANNNELFRYFEGTPVIALFVQFGLIVALVFFSQSRRFGRAVPAVEPSRLTKLEYVSAMAELQQRTRAYDLAIENIYSEFRRRVCALVGLDNTTASRKEIADRVAERLGVGPPAIEELLFECEDVIHGEPVGRKDTVRLIERIREIEEKLALKRSGRKRV